MRTRFIADHQVQRFSSFAELCRRYSISRKTGYKWLNRFEADGPQGLHDRSHCVLSCPHATPRRVLRALIKLRKRYPSWGAKKLLARLETLHPDWELPARSTAHDLLRQHGLVKRRRRRPQHAHPGRPVTAADQPNAIWTADFKGQFRTLDGVYCFPLTIIDHFSRFVLACVALLSTNQFMAQRVFEKIFREFGLPWRIRTDNGVPFATFSLGRLSHLSVWWIRLGILLELIEPGKPQQNGAHERFHRTLKADTTRPPERNRRAQQRRFNAFRDTFNTERPHEALDMQTPASLYHPSPRPFPNRLPPLEYPAHFEIRRVSSSGGIRWKNRFLNISTVLVHQDIGLEEIDDGLWTVYYAHQELGRLDERTGKITDLEGHENRMPHQNRNTDSL
jgi:transposase InsO family protein